MALKTMTIDGNAEVFNELQRLGYEIDSYRTIIDYLFTSHKDDASFLEGNEVLKTYMKDYTKVNAEYSKAKDDYGQDFLRPIVEKEFGEGIDFTWAINDFSSNKVEVTVTE